MKKKMILLVAMIFMINHALNAQALKNGTYTTADGMHYRKLELLSNGNIKTSVSGGYDIYESIGGNKYKGKTTVVNGVSSPASSNFYLEIISESAIFLYREGRAKTRLNLTSGGTAAFDTDDCTLYKKYMKKMEDEPANIQTYAFCANAALQLCNTRDANMRNEIIKQTVIALKAIYTGKTCPCPDVITTADWNKY